MTGTAPGQDLVRSALRDRRATRAGRLTELTCWQLLGSHDSGHLERQVPGAQVQLVPVGYRLRGTDVLLAPTVADPLGPAGRQERASLRVEVVDLLTGTGWRVDVSGPTWHLSPLAARRLPAWQRPAGRPPVLRLHVVTIEGRRLP